VAAVIVKYNKAVPFVAMCFKPLRLPRHHGVSSFCSLHKMIYENIRLRHLILHQNCLEDEATLLSLVLDGYVGEETTGWAPY
jgi:hypothetical protein